MKGNRAVPPTLADLWDPCRAFWGRSLALPPRSLAGTLLWELATYYRISEREALGRCRSAAAWRAAAPSSPQAVDAFYRQPLDYAFDLVWWHSLMRRDLDFGGGTGSHTLAAAACGFDVTLADVSADLLAFAEWRAALRGPPVRRLHLPREALEGPYDLILAVDVLEHLPPPAEILIELTAHLREGGFIFVNMAAGPSPDAPQHISFGVSN